MTDFICDRCYNRGYHCSVCSYCIHPGGITGNEVNCFVPSPNSSASYKTKPGMENTTVIRNCNNCRYSSRKLSIGGLCFLYRCLIGGRGYGSYVDPIYCNDWSGNGI